MDEMEQYISNGNIDRFVEKLCVEADPKRQDVLKRLLIEEEDRFGATVERLSMVERHLTEGASRIAKLRHLVA